MGIDKLSSVKRGIDKLTSSAIGMWEYRARFGLKTHCEWALATAYRALGSLSGSASPGLQVNLSIPVFVILIYRFFKLKLDQVASKSNWYRILIGET